RSLWSLSSDPTGKVNKREAKTRPWNIALPPVGLVRLRSPGISRGRFQAYHEVRQKRKILDAVGHEGKSAGTARRAAWNRHRSESPPLCCRPVQRQHSDFR